MEKEVFGIAMRRGPRVASIRVSDPINLLEHYSVYKSHKKETVEKITTELEAEVQNLVSGTK